MKASTPASFGTVFRRLLRFIKPYRKQFYAAVILIILSSALNSLAPFLLGRATDALVTLVLRTTPTGQAFRAFLMQLALLAGVYATYCVLKYLGIHIMAAVSERTIFDLRERMDDKLQQLPLRYYDAHAHGDTLSRVTNDVDVISTSLQQSLEQLITAVSTAVFLLVMMLVVSPLLTLIAAFTVPLSLFLSLGIAKRSQMLFRQQQDAIGTLSGYVEEMYTGHTIIDVFGKQADTIAEFTQKNEMLWRVGWKAQFLSGLLQPITQAVSNIGYVLLAVVSGWLCIQGRLSVGMIQSFVQYLRQFSQPIMQTAQITNMLQATVAAAARVFALLDETQQTPDATTARTITQVQGEVVFDHVSFGYTADNLLLRDVSFTVPAGSKVAIVGPTGAGKTTLVNLLLRFYEIDAGEIRIDGVPIVSMTRQALRALFGMVLQDTWLYTATIADNIAYGKAHATQAQVLAAAKAAHADDFISAQPHGYATQLSEDATVLAQGERQLLTIARAILADSPMMILDEATSSVDTRTELRIQQAMHTLMQGRTSFVIAHRLSTIRDADLILYMQQGNVEEIGTHAQLMQRGGLYAALYHSQFAPSD